LVGLRNAGEGGQKVVKQKKATRYRRNGVKVASIHGAPWIAQRKDREKMSARYRQVCEARGSPKGKSGGSGIL